MTVGAGSPGPAPTVTIRVDPYDRDGQIVVIDGVESSYVCLRDPTRLEFEYARWIGDLLDLAAGTAGAPLRVVHLGGGGCTLPLFVHATRPGSTQVVFESCTAVLKAARAAFGLDAVSGLRLERRDGLDGLRGEDDASADIVIRDAFAGDRVPEHLTTTTFVHEVARILRPDGLYVANVPSDVDLAGALTEARTALGAFSELVLIAEPGLLRGRRYGNVVLAGAHHRLPVEALARRLAAEPITARVLATDEVRARLAEHVEQTGQARY